MKKTLVVNLFAGPGTGKSTTMAHIFAELKWRGIDCEMSTEYAKDKVWEGSEHILNDQFYVSAKQYHRLQNLVGKVDVVITDSPLLLGLYYGNQEPKGFHELLVHKFNTFDNFNIFLRRFKTYNPNGRVQNEEQAIEIDSEILKIMNEHCPNAIFVDANYNTAGYLVERIVEILQSRTEIIL